VVLNEVKSRIYGRGIEESLEKLKLIENLVAEEKYRLMVR